MKAIDEIDKLPIWCPSRIEYFDNIECEYHQDDIGCDQIATNWFELQSRMTYRCDRHITEFSSTILSKGKLADASRKELEEVEEQIFKRLKTYGITKDKAEDYNKEMEILSRQIREWTPKKLKKELKKCKDPKRREIIQELYKTISRFAKREPVNEIMKNGLMRRFTIGQLLDLRAKIDNPTIAEDVGLLDNKIRDSELDNFGVFSKEEKIRIMRLSMSRKEYQDIVLKLISDLVVDSDPELDQFMRSTLGKCDQCQVHLKSLDEKAFMEHVVKAHPDFNNKVRDFAGSSMIENLAGVDMNDMQHILARFELEKTINPDLKIKSIEAIPLYKNFLIDYAIKTAKRNKPNKEKSNKSCLQFSKLVIKDFDNSIDLDTYFENVKICIEIMKETNYPLFPINLTFHKTLWNEKQKDPRLTNTILEAYAYMSDIDQNDISAEEKVRDFQNWFQVNCPLISKKYNDNASEVIVKNIMKIKSFNLPDKDKLRILEPYLCDQIKQDSYSQKARYSPSELAKKIISTKNLTLKKKGNTFVLDTDEVIDDKVRGFKDASGKFHPLGKAKEEIRISKELEKPKKPVVEPVVKPKKIILSYEEFQKFIKDKQIFNRVDFENYQKVTELPVGIPVRPENRYSKWHGWREATGLPPRKKSLTQEEIDGILNEIKTNWDLYSHMKEGMILWWFNTIGVFGIRDPIMRAFFTSFLEWYNKPKSRNVIWDYLEKRDDSIIERELLKDQKSVETKEEFLSRMYSKTEDKDVSLLDTKTETIEEIFKKASHYTPSVKNDKFTKTLRDVLVKDIWSSYFDNPKQVMNIRTTGKRFHDSVLHKFDNELKEVKYNTFTNQIKSLYKFSKGKPKIMQLYGAWKVKLSNGLLNMFGTGLGKTLTAILATKFIRANTVFWVCPKNVIPQTENMILDAFPDVSGVSTVLENPKDKTFIPDEFFARPDRNKKSWKFRTNYHLINYEQFSYEESAQKLLERLHGKRLDMIVLDESQMIKNPNEEPDKEEKKGSTRRKNILRLISDLRIMNPKLKVLLLTATPVVNNVREAMSLYKLITGTDLAKHGMSNYSSINNSAKMYVEFLPFSIRYEAKYDIESVETIVDCKGYLPDELSQDSAHELEPIELEQLLTEIRIPYMVEKALEIKKKEGTTKIVIYTDYKKGIVDPLQVAFTNAGFRVGLFTGDDKSGMGFNRHGVRAGINPFNEGNLEILIATRTFAVGVDGAQTNCNHMFFNGLVWTWTDFEQIRGRLLRTGQESEKVFLNLFFANVNGCEFDREVKYNRVLKKKALGDCIRDGRLPEEVSLGQNKKTQIKMIDQMLSERKSGFPTKEELNRLHAERAEEHVEAKLEKLQKEFPQAEFSLGETSG